MRSERARMQRASGRREKSARARSSGAYCERVCAQKWEVCRVWRYAWRILSVD